MGHTESNLPGSTSSFEAAEFGRVSRVRSNPLKSFELVEFRIRSNPSGDRVRLNRLQPVRLWYRKENDSSSRAVLRSSGT
ncbi:hypothetical protein C440_00055 [Haloferax mucosum ATCC BAA-1512]|uniref:Uncharacterized protein n=1 Tax=Haloferax mucosum ATCC BAA-1512 TaxID=662479 RepID=M0IPE8_9EURY|nr:hypothetical protein C440_00055 [Haloferax mucosum ATCC BAA-1512]